MFYRDAQIIAVFKLCETIVLRINMARKRIMTRELSIGEQPEENNAKN